MPAELQALVIENAPEAVGISLALTSTSMFRLAGRRVFERHVQEANEDPVQTRALLLGLERDDPSRFYCMRRQKLVSFSKHPRGPRDATYHDCGNHWMATALNYLVGPEYFGVARAVQDDQDSFRKVDWCVARLVASGKLPVSALARTYLAHQHSSERADLESGHRLVHDEALVHPHLVIWESTEAQVVQGSTAPGEQHRLLVRHTRTWALRGHGRWSVTELRQYFDDTKITMCRHVRHLVHSWPLGVFSLDMIGKQQPREAPVTASCRECDTDWVISCVKTRPPRSGGDWAVEIKTYYDLGACRLPGEPRWMRDGPRASRRGAVRTLWQKTEQAETGAAAGAAAGKLVAWPCAVQ
ncbi:hypothetical protein Micbo1qcDRAFT_207202 [Microdochium bolleyi]|uniref:Uncharacterized protein n=1 Tax=Microdochium bolleyi TaxID=196109 RepID=A0A136ITU9_9PEZI|nr:hypothetical protein Micbo1qcDRAFT_207202 [Microdochium bolleyi]